MNHMEQVLLDKVHVGRKIFVAYFPLGDPLMGNQVERVGEFLDAGVDVLELGVPYRNPVLDGPVVSASMSRALQNASADSIMESIANLRQAYPDACLQIMTYYEAMTEMGLDAFCAKARSVGADGILAPNVPQQAQPTFDQALDSYELLQPLFVPIESSDEALQNFATKGRGYLFLQAQEGKTGVRDGVAERVATNIQKLKQLGATAAICAGFGISKPAQVATLMDMGADGVIVGSSIIQSVLDGSYRQYLGQLRDALA